MGSRQTDRLYQLPDSRQTGAGIAAQTMMVLLTITVLACWIATQYAAHKLGYQATLGVPLLSFKGWKLYSPWDFFIWLWRYGHIAGTEQIWKIGEYIIASLHFLFVPAIWINIRAAKRAGGKSDLHGSAHWATKAEIGETGLIQDKPSGVYVGAWVDPDSKRLAYLTHDGPEHVLAFAPTRSGKGVGLVVPTLLSWRQSAVIHDIKGEAWALTAGFRRAIGQVCLKFDPTAVDGSSVKFNPLGEIRIGEEREIADVQNIATMIVDPDGKGLADHWAKTGHALLVGAILHVMYAEKDKTLRGVASFLSDPGRTMEQTMEAMMNTDHLGDRPHPVIAESARDMLNRSENERSGVLSTAMSFLSLYRDPIVARNTEVSEFQIRDIMNHENPVSLYLVVPPSDKDRLKPLVRLVLNQIVRLLTEKMEFRDGRSIAGYKHRLLLMIDEFPSLGKLEIMEEALAFIAGYGLKAYLICQDVSQLQKAYGREESIISNCHVRVAFAPNKIETAKVLSEMCGTMTVFKVQRNYSGNRLNPVLMHVMAQEQETQRPLLTPDECMRLPGPVKSADGLKILEPGDMLVFVAGFAPIYGKQILYFQDPVFDKRSKIPAPAKSDAILERTELVFHAKRRGGEFERRMPIEEAVGEGSGGTPDRKLSRTPNRPPAPLIEDSPPEPKGIRPGAEDALVARKADIAVASMAPAIAETMEPGVPENPSADAASLLEFDV
jgi:type IV secretion system protein VirD4